MRKHAKKAASKLNISVLGHKRIPSREGGVEVVVEELSTRLVLLGHSVTCYNRRGHHVGGRQFDLQAAGGSWQGEYKGVTIKSLPTIDRRGLAAATSSFWGACRVAHSKCDVVHFHAAGACAMLWIPKLFGKRCVVTIHGLDHMRAKWGKFARAYIRMGERCAARYADEIIVLSAGIQKYFLDTYGRKTHVIPNGISRPEKRPAQVIAQHWGLEKDEYILFLGRMVPEKGIQYLIDAFKGVSTAKKLVIAGGSSDTDAFVAKMKNIAAGDDRILFTGFTCGEELEELYSNAYLYVLPSDLEGMPLTLLEAMSYGNCCLISDIPESVDVTEDRALVFGRGDVDDLRAKLQGACDDECLVKTYKIQATDFICEKYSWDDVVEQTLRLYGQRQRVGTG